MYGDVGEEGFQAWSDILQGINQRALDAGFKSMIKEGDKFPPNPAYFLKLCKVVEGLKNAEEAYIESCMNANITGAKWSHDVVKEAAAITGHFELRSQPEARILPLYRRNYEVVLQRFMDGEDLAKPVPLGIEEKAPIEFTKEECQTARDKVKQFLNKK